MKLSSILLLVVLTLFGIFKYNNGSAQSVRRDAGKVISHDSWDALMKKHVDADGWVNYKGLVQDSNKLHAYTQMLSANAPAKNWTENEQLAYWINAYNAFTVQLIVDNYPVKSIQTLQPKLKIPMIKDVWHLKFFKIGDKNSSLNEIEHAVLRKHFDEPRIHFAINCASFSCPPLLNEAFMADKVKAQLEMQAKKFVNDPLRNKITADKLELSKIFSWFKGDFTKNGKLIDFLNKYSDIKINVNAKISHLDYGWDLNKQK